MKTNLLLVTMLGLTLGLATAAEAPAPPAPEWPAVLTIDDFEAGTDRWDSAGTGTLELVGDAPQGQHALRWTARDDGLGQIILKELDRKKIDFSQYDLLRFMVKVEGKPLWNLDPVVGQYPHAYGYLAHYYAVDTLEGFNRWIPYVQDLRKWENAWPDSFDAARSEFRFEVGQMAGAGHTVICLDDIQLIRNVLEVDRSLRGEWLRLADGGQATRFRVRVRNRDRATRTVRVTARAGTLKRFTAQVPAEPLVLAPGSDGELNVVVTAPPAVLKDAPAFYGETLVVEVTATEVPGLVLVSELTAGTRPETLKHPVVLCTPERQQELRRQWRDPAQRAQLPAYFAAFVQQGEKALEHRPQYPLLAHPGESTCPVDGATVARVAVPNLPMNRYQCPKCGRLYSGPFYDAAADGWAGQHLANAGAVRWLGIAYGLTGERRFAVKAAELLRGYLDVYLALPVAAPAAGSPAFSATSGAVRIGGSYMSERNWLTALAIGLDFVRETDVLSADDLRALTERVFAPSALLMLDHKVGVMNLQWMIAAAALDAGLAADDPQLVARAMYDSHGILNLMAWGYLPDGNWWENPSYQNVANGIAFPTLTTLLQNHLQPFDQRLIAILKAPYRLYGPDGRSPTLGTGGPGGYSYADNAIHSLANLIEDPELAWVAHHRSIWQAWSGAGSPYDSFLWAAFYDAPPRVPEAQSRSPIPDATVSFPDYGGIALRVPGAGNYCYLHYGRHLVHGHHNKLSINAYAKGGWFVRNVMGGYGDDFKDFLETVASASTVMVDGKNPDADTGELLWQGRGDWGEGASGRELGAWKDVEHERTVVLTRGPLIVLDRLLAAAPHRYDWLYHTCLTDLAVPTAGLLPPPEKLGETVHYNSLKPVGRFPTVGPVALTRKDGSGATLALTLEGELYAARALGKYDTLLWRREGATVTFTAAVWPHGPKETGTPTLAVLPVTDAAGKALGPERAQAVRATAPEGTWTVLVNYGADPVQAGDLKSTGRVTVTWTAPVP